MLDREVFPIVGNTWDESRIVAELRKRVPNLDEESVGRLLAERREGVDHGETFWGGCERGYFGRGIGTALCEAAVRWARENDYVAVLAPAPPEGLIEFARWSGHLPQTTYARLGFRATVVPPEERDAGWARGEIHEPIASEVRQALASGREPHEILERLMALDLRIA
jgi:GNAT superfamily N-acetyltransferase